MVSCIVGQKGKGKTKHLLEKVRVSQETSKGNLVYIDKNTKHMFELDKTVRLIDISEYPLSSKEAFLGFIYGMLSQNYDLEAMFLDSFLTIASCEVSDMAWIVKNLKEISEKYSVDFVLSVCADKEELPQEIYEDICVSL